MLGHTVLVVSQVFLRLFQVMLEDARSLVQISVNLAIGTLWHINVERLGHKT